MRCVLITKQAGKYQALILVSTKGGQQQVDQQYLHQLKLGFRSCSPQNLGFRYNSCYILGGKSLRLKWMGRYYYMFYRAELTEEAKVI